MQKSKNTGKFYRLFSIVRRTMAFVRIGRKYDRLTKKYPPLLTMQQTAELLDVHPNTLRAWDKQKKLRAVRIGVRKDRRYQRSDVVRLFERTQQISWPGQTLQRLRPFITLRTSFGLLAALLLISWAPKPFVHAEPSEDTISMRPAVCRGWTTPDGALNGSDVPAADTSDIPAAHLTINDIAVTAGLGSLNNIQQDFGCDDFSVPVDQSTVKLKSVRLVWNQAVIGTPNSLDVVRVEVRREGQKTSPVVLTPLNERSSGEKSAEMTGNWTFSDLQRASIHALVDIGSAEPFSVAINNPHFEVLVDRITPPKLDLKIDQKKFAKTSKTLDALVEFSKSAYATNEQPVVTVPKHETKKILFITAKKVDWTLDTVSIVDANNKPVTPKYATHDVTRGEETDTTINLQTAGFHPGKYTVKIKMKNSDGNDAVVEKTFFWGVVAVNFTRAAPQPHEVETVGIGVLDDKGRTICNADITVKIKDPRGKTFTFQTKKRSITLNPNCVDKNVTNEPDYHFNFTPHLVGTYHLTLKAKTEFGERTYEDNLIVASSQIFDVQRIDYPTRINPYAAYKVRIAITPRRDFTGVVYESVPSNFKVSQFQPAATVQDDPAHPGMKRIGWEVQWKKDATYYVGYKFVAPPISPALFQTGPLSIGGNDLLGADFSEPRQWQIASDSISSISWDGSASNLWSNPANWSTNAIPQAGDNVVFPAGAANYTNTNDLGENMWFNSITFYDSGYTLSGNTVIFGQGRATPAIILPGITDAVSSGGNTISMNLRFDATQIISVTNSGETLTISGGITGAGGVTKEGLGELVFSGGNKYGGVTKVNVGSLNVQNATGLGTIAAGTEVVGEAALEIQGNIDIDREALTLRGYGQSSSGALRNISGTNSFAGAVTIAGTTEIASDSGTLTMKGGVSGTFNLNLDGAGNITFSTAPIATGAGLVTKNGSGTLEFDFPNTYTGLTTVNAGTLLYGVDNAILSGSITVNGGTLDIASYSDAVATVTLGTLMGQSGTITGTSGVLSGTSYTVYAGTISAIIGGAAATLTKNTPGTVTLTRANTYTGAVTVNFGTLKIQDSYALGYIDGTTTISSGASLQIDGNGLSNT
jgi:autotransporter-associated beta strand protein